MIRYVGLDVHKRFVGCVFSTVKQGDRSRSRRLRARRAGAVRPRAIEKVGPSCCRGHDEHAANRGDLAAVRYDDRRRQSTQN
jgi:hypothetical protein